MLLVTAALHRESLPWRGLGLVHDGGNVTTVSPEVRMSQLATGRILTIFPAFVLRTKRNRPAEEPDAEPGDSGRFGPAPSRLEISARC
jgi:hypothetical protein